MFQGGFSLEAAESVCQGGSAEGRIEQADVVDILLRLVDRSLVVAEEAMGEERYHLLETIRQYAQEKLLDSGEFAQIRNRHKDWCLDLAQRAEYRVEGPNPLAWLDRIEGEHDNLRSALAWCLERDVETGLEIVGCLIWFWDRHCHFREGSAWAAELLARCVAETLPRARALRTAAQMATGEDDWARATELASESVRLSRQLGHQRELGRSLEVLAHCLGPRREEGRAEQLLNEAVEIARAVGDGYLASDALWELGWVVHSRDDYDGARQLTEESLALARRNGFVHGVAWRLLTLGLLDVETGDLVRAQAHTEAALDLFRREKHGYGEGRALFTLGFLAVLSGELGVARARLLEGVRCFQQIGGGPFVDGLRLAAELAMRSGDHARGTRLLATSGGDPDWQLLLRFHEVATADARSALGEEAFARAWGEGQAMTLERAVEYALRDEPPLATSGSPSLFPPLDHPPTTRC